jgi:hypothetical protein
MRVDAINTVRYIRRSRRVVSRCFAASNLAFPQFKLLFAPSSTPGTSMKGPQLSGPSFFPELPRISIPSTLAA